MARGKEPVIYLDTHIVAWLYDALTDRLSERALTAIDANELRISGLVKIELQCLYEIGRIRQTPDNIVNELTGSLGLRLSELPMEIIINSALGIGWTRDVFDRLIAAEALATGYGLVTKDVNIREHLKLAIW